LTQVAASQPIGAHIRAMSTVANQADRKWLAEAARAVTHEWQAYFRTVSAVIRHPARFAREWADGTRNALNPLAYALNAGAIIVPWVLVLSRLLRRDMPNMPLWVDALQSARGLLGALWYILPGHFALRLVGGKRPLRTSCAIFIYFWCGPLALWTFVIMPWAALYWRPGAPTSPLIRATNHVAFAAFVLIFAFYSTTMLAATHRLRLWRAVVAVVGMFALNWGLRVLAIRHAQILMMLM
jgi:hypothetical protein